MNQTSRKLIAALALAGLALLQTASHAGQVNVNAADASTLATQLDGVGLSRAEAIVAYRNLHGPFASVADLAKVKGIGARTLELNRGNIRFSEQGKAR